MGKTFRREKNRFDDDSYNHKDSRQKNKKFSKKLRRQRKQNHEYGYDDFESFESSHYR